MGKSFPNWHFLETRKIITIRLFNHFRKAPKKSRMGLFWKILALHMIKTRTHLMNTGYNQTSFCFNRIGISRTRRPRFSLWTKFTIYRWNRTEYDFRSQTLASNSALQGLKRVKSKDRLYFYLTCPKKRRLNRIWMLNTPNKSAKVRTSHLKMLDRLNRSPNLLYILAKRKSLEEKAL